MDHDALFKELLTTGSILRAFFEQFLPEVAPFVDFQNLEFVDKERIRIDGRKRTGDLLVKTRFRGKDAGFLIHMEHQAQHDPDLDRRMLEYFILDWMAFDLPVYPIAVLSHPMRGPAACAKVVVEFPNKRVLDFDYDVIDLARMDASGFVKLRNPAALALAARMRFDRKERIALTRDFFLNLAASSINKKARALIAGFFSSYQPLNHGDALQLREELLIVKPDMAREKVMRLTNPFIELGFRDGITQGIAKGIEQGIEQGMEKGRREGEVELVLRQLVRRVGALPVSQKKRIGKLDLPKLEALGESLLDFKSRVDLAAWLKKNAS